jgi:hypothetical protein
MISSTYIKLSQFHPISFHDRNYSIIRQGVDAYFK